MKQKQKKLIHEGNYMAEIEVELIYTEDEWSPYLSLEDAEKLDNIRIALRQNDFKTASQLGNIFELTPLIQK